jgi:hypothetical protein
VVEESSENGVAVDVLLYMRRMRRGHNIPWKDRGVTIFDIRVHALSTKHGVESSICEVSYLVPLYWCPSCEGYTSCGDLLILKYWRSSAGPASQDESLRTPSLIEPVTKHIIQPLDSIYLIC